MRNTRKRDRRGVLILIILSMLVLFILVAVAFVVTAGQHRTAAKAASRAQLTGNSPQQQLDEALRQLLRGTANTNSAFQDNSLLDDMYDTGEEGTYTSSANFDASGQLITMTVGALNNTTAQYYAGRVLTFTSGPAKGQSTRILSNPSATSLVVLPLNSSAIPNANDTFWINGRPFNGDGTAAQPNEDYDAVDELNLHLASIIPTATPPVTPSFDRSVAGGTTERAFGALTDPGTDPWDVDNDGDGVFDSIWIDAGFPVQTAPDGQLYKALVAVLCVDLDGRLNLNAHGSFAHDPGYRPAAQTLAGGTTTTHDLPRGEGYGPPEIAIKGLLGGDFLTYLQGTATVYGRYGANSTIGDRTPGLYDTYDNLGKLRLFQYPENFSTNTLSAFGSPSNVQGNLAFGLGDRGELIYDGTNTNQLSDNPYELNLSRNAPSGVHLNAVDTPFSLAELERVLRPFDADSSQLPSRLVDLASSTDIVAQRHKLTTHSFDLPIFTTDPGGSDLRTQLSTAGYTLDDQLVNQPWPVAPELILGLPMDLNRPFGNGRDDNANNVVDEEEEAGSETLWATGSTHALTTTGYNAAVVDRNNDGMTDTGPTDARQIYARQLYTLLSLQFNSGADANIARTLAQWAINVVDFRDADSIMTRFDYDPAPLSSGWAASETVWGCERPELLITETFAFHDRRTEDRDDAETADGMPDTKTTAVDPAVPDDDFDQYAEPRSAFYAELYNPWPIGSLKAPGELFDSGGNGVELGRMSGGATPDPVWRMIVVRGDSKGKDPEDPDDPVVAADIERSIFFTTGLGSGTAVEGKSYNPTTAGGNVTPGQYAVIGTAGTSYVGDRNDGVADRRRIVLSANDVQVFDETGGTVSRSPAALPAAPVGVQINGLSVSAPTGIGGDADYSTYPHYDAATDPANPIFNPPVDIPIDKTRSEDVNLDLEALWSDDADQGEGFRWIYLQRLANPLQPYHATNNPYLTVDAQPINLISFNGNSATSDPGLGANDRLVTHQRGDTAMGVENNIWQRGESNLGDPSPTVGSGLHHFDFNLAHTLGYINKAYNAADPPATNNPTQPFPWLVWNNRPFVSQFELMQVPFTRSSKITKLHNAPGAGTTEAFDYLLDFSSSGTFYTLFDYVNVPSRFVDAQQTFNPATFAPTAGGAGYYPFHTPQNRVSRFRDPGRINLNTIHHQDVWNGLMHDVTGMIRQPGPTWAQFQASQATPYRSFNSGAASSTLLRDGATMGASLFSGTSAVAANDTSRNSYFRHQAVQRMGNLVTTRSNVYAVWMTLGYFKVDAAGAVQVNSNQGVELGADMGAVRRHRAFYIIDRTVPVAFEAGKDHNSQDAVLLRSFIE